MKTISVVTPCYNEELNVQELRDRVRAVFEGLPQYDHEHIFIDNASTDRTVEKLKEIAAVDPRVKVIVNSRNFGQIRSPTHAMMQATGDCVLLIVADLQDPPEMIPQLLAEWEKGFRVVFAVKSSTQDSLLLGAFRKLYYRLIAAMSEVPLVKDATGFGVYDGSVIDVLREIDDPYPYMRGLLCDIGGPISTIPYDQPRRKRGLSSNNFFSLFDIAMLGITSHSRVPLRLATFLGFGLSAISMGLAIAYLVAKLVYWDSMSFGVAPLLIGVFFFASVQLFFTGVLGEYIGVIHTQTLRRPLVVERQRINFDQRASPNTSEVRQRL